MGGVEGLVAGVGELVAGVGELVVAYTKGKKIQDKVLIGSVWMSVCTYNLTGTYRLLSK